MKPPAALSAEEQAKARKAVYEGRVSTISPKGDFLSELEIPPVLSELYKKNPSAVLDLLTRIADGGNPADSIRAASYAIELADGPGCGLGCVLVYKVDTYDVVDKRWGHTPREHWVTHLRAKLKK
jgi:hypothetical protein